MSELLKERLQTHSNTFDGLLSLIPAKYYYDDATQDQWQQTKQSKQDLAANKRAKLDPSSKKSAQNAIHASAKDVMASREATAKKVVLPGQRKVGSGTSQKLPNGESGLVKGENKSADETPGASQESESESESGSMSETMSDSGADSSIDAPKSAEAPTSDSDFNIKDGQLEFDDLVPEQPQQGLKQKQLSAAEKEKRDANLAALRERLASRINILKEKRRAPGTSQNGAPKSRDEILAERARKLELRKKRKLAKMEEEEEDDDDDDDDDDEAGEEISHNSKDDILFGNIVFRDGSRVTSDLTRFRNSLELAQNRGPARNDLKGHLAKLEAKKRRDAELAPDKQVEQAQKDQWLRMMAQAEGIKVKDDERLLKKALKRKEKQKLKSEVEWRERKQVVKDTVAARAKRVEENLKARRDQKGKGSKGKKGKHQQAPRLRKFTGLVNKAAKSSSKKRAGFEGSAKNKKK